MKTMPCQCHSLHTYCAIITQGDLDLLMIISANSFKCNQNDSQPQNDGESNVGLYY